QEVFIAVLAGIDALRDDAAFRGWLTQVTVFAARGAIRKKRRKWWLVFTDAVPDQPSEPESDASDAVRAVYRVLEAMDADDRIAFALRKIDGMELTEVAASCVVSLATIKRRLVRAETKFRELAAEEDSLASWLEGGKS
ncbi:MAG: sigma-70 family RNA polymerase sigma factor, partial [Polyangiaceae bacterium]